MHINHASTYAKLFGVTLDAKFECASPDCTTKVAVREAFAFPGRSAASGEVKMYIFCCLACYFDGVPLEACSPC